MQVCWQGISKVGAFQKSVMVVLLSAPEHSGSLKQVSQKKKKAEACVMSPLVSSQCCDYWRLPSLICVIPIFSDSWVRALRGTLLSGRLPRLSCWKGFKLLFPQQHAAWQFQLLICLYYCYLNLGALMIAWIYNFYSYVLRMQVWHIFFPWLHKSCFKKKSNMMFFQHWLYMCTLLLFTEYSVEFI